MFVGCRFQSVMNMQQNKLIVQSVGQWLEIDSLISRAESDNW